MYEKELEEKWRSLTIKDNFIFGKTMESAPDLCRRLLEKILHVKIKSISYPEREKVLSERLDSKGIRLDIYVEDKDTNRSFDIEMQVTDSAYLAKRMRYYQGLIDMDKLKQGQHYGALGESYIIFICPFDKFKRGKHIYTFKETCAECSDILLGDGATKIFLSTKGTADDVDADVKAFLNYVDSGIIEGAFVEEFEQAVQNVKFNTRTVKEFMTYEMTLLEKRMEGKTEGKIEAMEDVAMTLLEMGTKFENIQHITKLSMQRIKELAEKVTIKN